jgi:hypothetical protein
LLSQEEGTILSLKRNVFLSLREWIRDFHDLPRQNSSHVGVEIGHYLFSYKPVPASGPGGRWAGYSDPVRCYVLLRPTSLVPTVEMVVMFATRLHGVIVQNTTIWAIFAVLVLGNLNLWWHSEVTAWIKAKEWNQKKCWFQEVIFYSVMTRLHAHTAVHLLNFVQFIILRWLFYMLSVLMPG